MVTLWVAVNGYCASTYSHVTSFDSGFLTPLYEYSCKQNICNVAVFHSEHYYLALSKGYSLLFWLAKNCVMISVCTVDSSCSASYYSTGCRIQLTQLECPQVQESWAMQTS